MHITLSIGFRASDGSRPEALPDTIVDNLSGDIYCGIAGASFTVSGFEAAGSLTLVSNTTSLPRAATFAILLQPLTLSLVSANPPLDTCYGMLQIKDTNGSVLLSNLSVSPRAVNQPSITRGSRSLFNRPWPVTIAILPITSCLSRSLRPCPVLFAIAGVNCGSTSNLHNKSTSTRASSQLCKKSKLWISKQFRSEPSFSKELCNAPAKV